MNLSVRILITRVIAVLILWIFISVQYQLHCQADAFENINFETVQFKHLNSQQGLAHNRVHSMIMDDQGFMWFGTQDGLSRWDGRSIKSYYPRVGDSTAISGSLVTDIEKDKKGNLWIVSHQGDLCKYDPFLDQFKTYNYPDFENGIVLTSEMEIFIDSEDIIWIGCFDDGLIRFDPEQNKFGQFDVEKNLKRDDDRVKKNSVLVITEDNLDSNLLWLGTNNGLFSFNKDSEEVKHYSASKEPGGDGAIRGIHKENANEVWVATLGSGIAKYNIENDKWEYFLPNVEMWEEFNFNFNYINDFENKSENEFWVSSGDYGSGIFNIENKSFHFFKKSNTSNTSISSERGFKVYVDPYNTVWWSHENNGVSYNEPNCQIFQFRNFDLSGNEASWNRFLADLTIDKTSGKIYGVGHVNDGLFEIDHHSRNTSRIPLEGFEGQRQQYDAVLSTRQGEVLVGGFHSRYPINGDYTHSPLLVLDRDIQKLRPFKIDKFKKLQQKNINDLYQDKLQNIWIATDDGFLYSYNQNSDVLEEYFLETIHGTGINNIIEDTKRNKLFLATFDGIISFDLSSSEFEIIPGTEEFSSKGITMSKDLNYLWIGTRQIGVQCYEIETKKLLPISLYRNAPRTPVEKVLLDKEDRLWATTERGVYLLKPELKSFFDFSAQNGIEQDYFYSQGTLVLDDGTIILGQQGGYYYFQPEILEQTLESGPAMITEVLVNQSDINKQIDEEGDFYLDLPYNQNSLTIGFSSVSYCQQDKVLFNYKLEGLEEEWLIPFNNARTVNYPSLRPGKYTFMVKKVGEEDHKMESMIFNIAPPFWRSWLAYFVYLCAILYAINWLFGIKLRQQKDKEELKTKISSDIHDDVGSLLAGLAMQSEIMALDKKGEERDILLEISTTGREAIERLRDIVWVLDSRKDKYKNLKDRMKHFADSKFRNSSFKYSFDIGKLSDQQFISPDLRQNLFLIFKEAVTNLIKHSNGNVAELSFKKTGKKIVLRIYDNGTGEITNSDGLGLSNMQIRADRINGKLSVKQDNGFEVLLEVGA